MRRRLTVLRDARRARLLKACAGDRKQARGVEKMLRAVGAW